MVKRICDNCSQDTGSSIARGYCWADGVIFGERDFACTVRFVLEPPIPKDEEEEQVDLCIPCMQAAVLKACQERIAKQKKQVGTEHFNGS